jgi:hypothetical protein
MAATCRVKNPTLMAGKVLAFEVVGDMPEIQCDPGETLALEIKRPTKKRSLDANAYCWVLLGKLAAEVGLSPEEAYRQCVKDIGGNYWVVPIPEAGVETYVQHWGHNGIGWVCDVLGPCKKTPGYVNVITYWGSSEYDTATMSRLIDRVVRDCKDLGIETLTPAELGRLKDDWRNAERRAAQ